MPIIQSGNLFRLRVHNEAAQPDETVTPAAEDTDSPAPVQSTADANEYRYEYRQPTKLSISELKRMYSDMTPDSTALFDNEPMFEPPAFLRDRRGISSMRIGTALHTVTEHINWHEHTTPEAIEGLIGSLTERNLLTGEEAAAIDRDKILRLTHSAIADRIRSSSRVYREVPFVMRHDFYDSGEEALLHGIIDCFFEEDGEAVLLDYKSDRVTVAPADWASNHALQMSVYKKAVAEATGLNVKETWLYSFYLGEAVRV
jgi:ATP-dependent helicase/nuclease subunit A